MTTAKTVETLLVLIETKILNEEKFEEYLKGHLPTIQAHGGSIKKRILRPNAVLGINEADVLVLQEWPNLEAFEGWFHSNEYQKWALIRDQACTLRITPLINS